MLRETIQDQQWDFVLCDEFEKVFADSRPRPLCSDIPMSVFIGTTVSFQLAFLPPRVRDYFAWKEIGALRVEVRSGQQFVRLSRVELMPCRMVAHSDADSGYLRTTPGLYPDLLEPLVPGRAFAPHSGSWNSIWIDVSPKDFDLAGEQVVTIALVSERSGEDLCVEEVVVRVIPRTLPDLSIVNTHWFHCDSLADYYGLEVFGEEHWAVIESFVAEAAESGINSLMAPAWTAPVDTPFGKLRTPTQLIRVTHDGRAYEFNFEGLDRWLSICRKYGMKYVELPHLFTQWGATHTPAIYLTDDDGSERRIFGWDVNADDDRYRRFLQELLPSLRSFLDERWGIEDVIFHVSDEPSEPSIDTYSGALSVVRDLLEGCVVADALSDYEFFNRGLVQVPIVATDALQPFLESEVENLWAYYCVAQTDQVANRFMALPSVRNFVLGRQLFAFDIRGFLHWGYNYYNDRDTQLPMNPFEEASCHVGDLAGDAYLVYPSSGRVPLPSIRLRVFASAMTEHRVLTLVSDLVGRERVMEIIDPSNDLYMTDYSYDPDFYRRTREELHKIIATT